MLAHKQPGISAVLGNRLPRQRNNSPDCLLSVKFPLTIQVLIGRNRMVLSLQAEE
jgi:hypothetical protein